MFSEAAEADKARIHALERERECYSRQMASSESALRARHMELEVRLGSIAHYKAWCRLGFSRAGHKQPIMA